MQASKSCNATYLLNCAKRNLRLYRSLVQIALKRRQKAPQLARCSLVQNLVLSSAGACTRLRGNKLRRAALSDKLCSLHPRPAPRISNAYSCTHCRKPAHAVCNGGGLNCSKCSLLWISASEVHLPTSLHCVNTHIFFRMRTALTKVSKAVNYVNSTFFQPFPTPLRGRYTRRLGHTTAGPCFRLVLDPTCSSKSNLQIKTGQGYRSLQTLTLESRFSQGYRGQKPRHRPFIPSLLTPGLTSVPLADLALNHGYLYNLCLRSLLCKLF